MKLFQTTTGFIIAFGFDMIRRKPDPYMVAWCDPKSLEWDTKADNQAGFNVMTIPVFPDFVHETADGSILAYQSDVIQMRYVGAPFVWSFHVLKPKQFIAA